MKSKNYCLTARLDKESFTDLIGRFPDFYEKLRQHSKQYQDKLKRQLLDAVSNLEFFEGLPEDTIEDMLHEIKQE